MKERHHQHENKHLIMHEQVAFSLAFFFLHESAEETPICSLGSDAVVNSFKNSKQTK